MPKTKIVITEKGFITSKNEKDVLKTDEVILETKSEEEAENIIHGQH